MACYYRNELLQQVACPQQIDLNFAELSGRPLIWCSTLHFDKSLNEKTGKDFYSSYDSHTWKLILYHSYRLIAITSIYFIVNQAKI